jgi:hypothetical protein
MSNELIDNCPANIVEAAAYIKGCEQMFNVGGYPASTASNAKFELLLGLRKHYLKMKENGSCIQ